MNHHHQAPENLMDLQRFFRGWAAAVLLLLLVFFHNPSPVTAGDIVHDDDSSPKKPGCENDFVLVKVQTWVNGIEDSEFVGVGARFGTTIVSKEKNANQIPLTLSDPLDCCSPPKNKLAGDVIMVNRGHCKFTTKANVAEAAGASAVLIVNNQKELYKMVCEPDETDLDIHIPAVMLPQDAGASLEKMLMNSSSVSVQLYSPRRPVVDIAEVFLWLMAVGTILCASYWSAWSAREAAIEQDKLLKDASDEFPTIKDVGTSGVVDINMASAALFAVIASCFLVILYKLMSSWFIELLVVLFAIGGAEGLQTCFVALLSRWFNRSAESYIKLPLFGAVSYLTLAVSPFCIAFAVVWAVKRNASFAWIGQDVLGIALIITVLQIVRVPNLKVGTVLLGCAFLYDIFWVFVSKKLFHESVGTDCFQGYPAFSERMVVVSNTNSQSPSELKRKDLTFDFYIHVSEDSSSLFTERHGKETSVFDAKQPMFQTHAKPPCTGKTELDGKMSTALLGDGGGNEPDFIKPELVQTDVASSDYVKQCDISGRSVPFEDVVHTVSSNPVPKELCHADQPGAEIDIAGNVSHYQKSSQSHGVPTTNGLKNEQDDLGLTLLDKHRDKNLRLTEPEPGDIGVDPNFSAKRNSVAENNSFSPDNKTSTRDSCDQRFSQPSDVWEVKPISDEDDKEAAFLENKPGNSVPEGENLVPVNDTIQINKSSKVAQGSAVWDIFRRQDVPKLTEYLKKHRKEFHHINNCPVNSVCHPIHDQTFYLNERHKKQLKEEYNVEPWTFEQYVGEAVFIPAGCPHQVRNRQSCIKVALDFVSPDNVQECIRLTEEFRMLPKSHRSKEDKLEVKKLALYAASVAISEVKSLLAKLDVKDKDANHSSSN